MSQNLRARPKSGRTSDLRTSDASSDDESASTAVDNHPVSSIKSQVSVFGSRRPSLAAITKLVRSGKIRNIVALVGAGISCSAGIPDFRSRDTGLYDTLRRSKRFKLPGGRAEALFDGELPREAYANALDA